MTNQQVSATSLSRWQKLLLDLEGLLLDPETRHSIHALEKLLHPDFVEFGSSGRIYDRKTMIEMLIRQTPAEVVIRDFVVRPLAPNTALVTYRSIGHGGQEVRRSSIWVRDETGWRLTFHQGTKIPSLWGGIA